MYKILIFIIVIMSIISCGGGGSSGSVTSGTVTPNNTNSISHGQFIDAKVQGLDYNCSSGISGTTDSNGTFSCKENDTISFYIDSLYLGSANVAPIITPYNLWNNVEYATNVAQILQTLDSEKNNEDKIVLSGNSIDNVQINSVDFDQNIQNKLTVSLVTNTLAQDKMNVNLALNNLNFSSIKNNNISEQNIFSDLTLPTSSKHGVTISWESNSTHINSSGVVQKKLNCSDNNIDVKLTANATSGTYTNKKEFILKIKMAQGNDKDCDFIPDDIENMLGLNSSNNDENNNSIPDGIDGEFGFGDPFYKNQWHLKARGTVVNNTVGVSTIVGNDLDLDSVYSSYMGYNQGSPIIISVVDNGVDINHEDLRQNIDTIRSRNAVNGSHNPLYSNDNIHGTMVAGIIAARGFNKTGVRGIAPFAKIAGNNWLDNQTYEELEKAWVTGEGANEIAVCNNSWGSEYDNGLIMESLLRVGATTLRNGKGRIYVKAAGNSRYNRGNSNLSNNSNNRYIITVAALKNDNTYASYSSYGSNILISGYSGEFYNTSPTIGTTTVTGDTQLPTWDEDVKRNYTFAMNGTSAASPTVSGSIALILEACPTLTYRDVKYILAKTAKRVDISNSSWIQNGAGLWHSVDYGYGLINTKGAINMCKNSYTKLPTEKTTETSITTNTAIPDDDNTGVSFTIHVNQNFTIEWLGIYPEIEHTYQGDLEILLTSPSGTITQLVQEHNVLEYKDDFYNGNARLGSTAFIDENSQGDWVVTVKDKVGLDHGTVKKIKLEIVGH